MKRLFLALALFLTGAASAAPPQGPSFLLTQPVPTTPLIQNNFFFQPRIGPPAVHFNPFPPVVYNYPYGGYPTYGNYFPNPRYGPYYNPYYNPYYFHARFNYGFGFWYTR